MAKKTPHTPQQAATQKGGGLFGRMRQAFSRNKSPQRKTDAFTATATGADRAIGRAHGMLSRVNQITVFGGMVAGGLAMMGKLPLVGGFFNAASEAAKKPEKFMENTTVRDMGGMASKTLGRVKDAAAARKGVDAGIVSRLGKLQENVGGVESGLARTTSRVAHRVTDPLGSLVEKRGADALGKLSARAGRGAEKHAGKAQGLLEELLNNGKGNEALSGVRGSLEAAQKALGGEKGLNGEAYAKAMEDAKKGLGEVAKGAVDKKTLAGLKKGIEHAAEAGATAGQRSGMAAKLTNLPGAIRRSPETLANANLKNVALKGAVVTGTALQITGTARGIGEKVHTLKDLYCDLTGEKKISTRKLLFSKNVPEVIKEARGHILKEYGPRVVLNFANTIATYTFMKNTNMKSMLGSFGLMAASSLHAAKVQSYGILPMYEALNQKPQIEPVEYAGFIAAASKDAAAAGGMESPLVQALAMDYAKQGMRPSAILKEIETGRFDERAMQKVQENRAAMEQSGGYSNPQAGMAGREVMGAHTQRLQEQTRNTSQHAR